MEQLSIEQSIVDYLNRHAGGEIIAPPDTPLKTCINKTVFNGDQRIPVIADALRNLEKNKIVRRWHRSGVESICLTDLAHVAKR
jgi:hypothetical protein